MANYAAVERQQAELGARLDRIFARLALYEQSAVERNLSLPDPVEWAERITGARLDPWQCEVLRSNHPALLLLTSRQVGKSHVVSLRAAYRARYLNRRVGVLSPTLRQSSIVYRRAKSWLRADGTAHFTRETLTELEIQGGGAVVAFPGDRPDLSIRGDTLDDLIVDEAALVKDQLIAAATPTTATKLHASITYLSSPQGARGAFYKAWSNEDFWHKVRVLARDCPRIRPEFLAYERERLGKELFSQEYECEFLIAPGGLLDPEALRVAFGQTVEPASIEWLPNGDGAAAREW